MNLVIIYLFIYTINEEYYLITSKEVTAINSINVGPKYYDYLVEIKTFAEFISEQSE